MHRAPIAILAILVSIGSVHAEDLPRFDIKAHCIAKAGERGGQASCQRASRGLQERPA